jgi:hypothetical protein
VYRPKRNDIKAADIAHQIGVLDLFVEKTEPGYDYTTKLRIVLCNRSNGPITINSGDWQETENGVRVIQSRLISGLKVRRAESWATGGLTQQRLLRSCFLDIGRWNAGSDSPTASRRSLCGEDILAKTLGNRVLRVTVGSSTVERTLSV